MSTQKNLVSDALMFVKCPRNYFQGQTASKRRVGHRSSVIISRVRAVAASLTLPSLSDFLRHITFQFQRLGIEFRSPATDDD